MSMGHSSSAYSLLLVMPSRQRDGGQHDDRLPAPEGERGERRKGQLDVAGVLYHVIGTGEQCATTEGKDDRIGVQRPQAAEGQPGYVEVECRPGQLCGDQYTHRHADQAPHDGHDGKLPNDFVIVGFCGCHLVLPRCLKGIKHLNWVDKRSATRARFINR